MPGFVPWLNEACSDGRVVYCMLLGLCTVCWWVGGGGGGARPGSTPGQAPRPWRTACWAAPAHWACCRTWALCCSACPGIPPGPQNERERGELGLQAACEDRKRGWKTRLPLRTAAAPFVMGWVLPLKSSVQQRWLASIIPHPTFLRVRCSEEIGNRIVMSALFYNVTKSSHHQQLLVSPRNKGWRSKSNEMFVVGLVLNFHYVATTNKNQNQNQSYVCLSVCVREREIR